MVCIFGHSTHIYKAVDLLRKMLQKNPGDRISAKEALSHPWICNPFRKEFF